MKERSYALTHEQAEELLPWLVNGSLARGERRALEEHLAACSACHGALARERTLATSVREAVDAELATEAGVERLRHLIAREERRTRIRRQPSRRMLLAAVLVQGVVLAGLLGLIAWLVQPTPEAGFRTLSIPEAETQAAGPRLQLLIDDGTAVGELQRVVREAGCRIVDGPTAGGVFRLEAPDGRLDEALATLRESPDVLLAEPLPERQ